MQTWTQNYTPLGSPILDPLIAALPIVLLLGLLATGRVSAHLAALAGLVSAVVLGIFVFVPAEAGTAGLVPWAGTVLTGTINGAAFGLFPIGWIVFSAIFLYSLTVETGQFEIVKHSVTSLSDDRRIQALLIAFSFGAFVEGAAGFGTPVAISAALMMGAGFRPLQAAGLALIANTSPVAFGTLGTPIKVLADVTGLDEMKLSQMAGRQLPFFSLLVPAWMVCTMSGWRATLKIWPALLVCGGSFALVQFLTSNFHGPTLVDVAGGVVSLIALSLFMRVWKPREIWHFPDEPPPTPATVHYRPRQVFSAWIPWALLTLFVFLWGLPQVKTLLGEPNRDEKKAFDRSDEAVQLRPAYLGVKVPGLHARIIRGEAVRVKIVDGKEVIEEPKPENAVFSFNWLTATGTSIFLAALLSAVWMRMTPAQVVRVFGQTVYRLRWPLFTIACMLAIAYTTRYTGMDATLGIAFTRTGFIYPLFAALLGWLGVALTGSDTSSNALFGSLQTITASNLVNRQVLPFVDPQPARILLATANSTGGVMGKMIDAQSIVVSAAATQQPGQEGAILRFVFWHSLVLAILMGLLVMAQAYWLTWMIP